MLVTRLAWALFYSASQNKCPMDHVHSNIHTSLSGLSSVRYLRSCPSTGPTEDKSSAFKKKHKTKSCSTYHCKNSV